MSGRKYTTETFIEKSKEIFGDLYEYPETEYKGLKEKTKFLCKQHGPFTQGIERHLLGKQGCPECYRDNCANRDLEVRTENFLKQAKEIHGDVYDYSQVVYKNNSTKVTITCKIHGDFEQLPSGHLVGKGCQMCGIDKNSETRRLLNEDFVNRSRETHGDFYLYDKVKFSTVREKVEIICPKHGSFLQTAYHHYNGSGCPKCGSERTSRILKNEYKDNIGGYYSTPKTSFLYLMEINSEFLKIGLSKHPVRRGYSITHECGARVEVIKRIVGKADLLFKFEQDMLHRSRYKRHFPKLDFSGKYECFKLHERENLMKEIDNFYMENFSNEVLSGTDIFKTYYDIPKHIRDRAEYSIRIYIQEVLVSDIVRASWEKDSVLMEEITNEIRDIMNQYILDAAMDWW